MIFNFFEVDTNIIQESPEHSNPSNQKKVENKTRLPWVMNVLLKKACVIKSTDMYKRRWFAPQTLTRGRLFINGKIKFPFHTRSSPGRNHSKSKKKKNAKCCTPKKMLLFSIWEFFCVTIFIYFCTHLRCEPFATRILS